MAGVALTHVPPEGVAFRVVVSPTHIPPLGLLITGTGYTLTILVAAQPVADTM
jgi:hypothetical protein